jgi:type IV pilus assembly protein PilC
MSSLYYYTARRADGLFVRGSIQTATDTAALASLRTRALFVTSLQSAATPRGVLAAALQLGPVTKKDLVTFFRGFSTLVRAGVDIRRSLDVTLEQCRNRRLREALASTVNDVECGLALSEALSRHPHEFPRVLITMIKSGEAAGALDDVLDRIASVLERDHAVRKRAASALAYPAIVAVAATTLVVFLMTSVVPAFRAMYDQMHVPIPWITEMLMRLGMCLRRPQLWIVAGLAAFGAVLVVSRSVAARDGAMEDLTMRVPLAGPILRKAALAEFARMLGTLLHSGVALVAALDVVADLVRSATYRRSIAGLRSALAEGASFSEPLARSGLYEPMFVQLVRVGEETGALDAMLLRIAQYYDLDVETALNALGSVLEPFMILLLGGAVGFIVAAVFIPLYTLIGSIK